MARRAEGRIPQWVLPAVGAVVAGLAVVAIAGVFGEYATDGYADPLWALAITFAVLFGLVLPVGPGNVAAAAIGVAVAGLTKNEGTATGAVVVVLMVVRYWRTGASAANRRRAVAGGVVALGALAAWVVVTTLLHADADNDTSGRRLGSVASRLSATYHGMVPHLHVLPVVAGVAVVGTVLLGVRRRRLGLAGDGWLWAVLVWNLVVVAGTYAWGTADIQFWLLTSVERTTTFPVVLGLASVAVWTVVAAATLVGKAGQVEGTGGRGGAGRRGPGEDTPYQTAPPLDGAPSPVLHTSHDHLRPPVRSVPRGL